MTFMVSHLATQAFRRALHGSQFENYWKKCLSWGHILVI